MRIAVVPASTKSGVATVKSLLSKPVPIRGFYRDLSKVPAPFPAKANFTAVEGDISNEGSIDLTGSDTVLAIIPSIFDGRDLVEHAERTSLNIKSAIQLAGGIKRFVLLSSGGAEFSEGVVRTFGAYSFPMLLLRPRTGRNQDKQQGRGNTTSRRSRKHCLCPMCLLHGELDHELCYS